MKDGSEESIVCFKYGSCIANPGSCGAGAVLYISGEEDTQIKRPVTMHGLILLAIMSVLEHLIIKAA